MGTITTAARRVARAANRYAGMSPGYLVLDRDGWGAAFYEEPPVIRRGEIRVRVGERITLTQAQEIIDNFNGTGY